MGCKNCHLGPLFTDQKLYTTGKQGIYDHQDTWDTPTLIETWRTAPYLHDGRCATMKEVFKAEKHELDVLLPEKELDQLVEFVLSL